MANDLAIRNLELKSAQNAKVADLADSAIHEVSQLIRDAIRNPIVSLVGSVALIEYLQTVWVVDSYYQDASGRWFPTKKRLISQPLATLLEGILISTEALKTVTPIIAPLIGQST